MIFDQPLPPPPKDVAEELRLWGAGTAGGPADGPLWEAHAPGAWLLLLAQAGTMRVTLGGAAHGLSAGDMLFLPAEGPVRWEGGAESRCYYALLGGRLTEKFGAALPRRMHPGPGCRAESLLRPLCGALERDAAPDGCWGAEQAFALLMCLRAAPKQAVGPSPAGGPSLAGVPPLVAQAADLIRREYAYLDGLDDLAQRLGVSKPHLVRRFSGAMGFPPGQFLTQVRIDAAKLLLQGGRHRLETVANMVGFSGANYFCKVFKRFTGMTPGEYVAQSPRAVPPEAEELEQVFYL